MSDVSISVEVDRYIRSCVAYVRVVKIDSPLLNENARNGEWNFEPVPGKPNVRVVLRRATDILLKTKILHAYFNQFECHSIEEGDEYLRRYFESTMKLAGEGLKNYNDWEREHVGQREALLAVWHGRDTVTI